MANDVFVLGGNFDVGSVGTSFGQRRCFFFWALSTKMNGLGLCLLWIFGFVLKLSNVRWLGVYVCVVIWRGLW